jgi:hypothetical protein
MNLASTAPETLAVRCDLPDSLSKSAYARFRCYGWSTRVKGPVTSFSPPDLPAGLSSVFVHLAPTGISLRAEGNLTALRYGPERTAGSLPAEDYPDAVRLLVGNVRRLVPEAPVDLWSYDVRRFDPSLTIALPVTDPVAGVVASCGESWIRLVKGHRTLSRVVSESGTTATLYGHGKPSWTAYDKSGDAARKGQTMPPNSLRLEVRNLPRKPLPLNRMDVLMSESVMNLSDLIRTVDLVTSEGISAMVDRLMEGQTALGEDPDPAEAWRLAGPALALRASGRGRLSATGLSRQTITRMDTRITALIAAAGPQLWDRPLGLALAAGEVVMAPNLDGAP